MVMRCQFGWIGIGKFRIGCGAWCCLYSWLESMKGVDELLYRGLSTGLQAGFRLAWDDFWERWCLWRVGLCGEGRMMNVSVSYC